MRSILKALSQGFLRTAFLVWNEKELVHQGRIIVAQQQGFYPLFMAFVEGIPYIAS